MAGIGVPFELNNPTKIQETVPTDTSKNNPSLVIDDTDPNNSIFTKTINGVSYQKTISTSGAVTTFSAWVQI